MCCGSGDGSAVLYATVDDSDVLITSSDCVPVMNSSKSMYHVSCIVSRMTLASQTQWSKSANLPRLAGWISSFEHDVD
jgi:hypothetical protein